MDSFFDFIMTHPPVKRLRVNDLLLAEYQCPLSEYRYDIWSHCNYFIYVISGEKEWFTLKERVHVKKGDCIFVRKGAQSVYQFFDSGFCALVLFVPDSFIRSALLDNQIKIGNADESSSDESLFTVKSDDRLTAYFHSFYTYLTASGKPETGLIELKFKELVILSAGLGNKHLSNYYAVLCRSEKPSIREIVNSNFNYPMNLEEYARLCGRSLSAFKREFKEIFGSSPGRWLTTQRLELAKYLLENTDKAVMEAALEAGFNNHSHFSRAFKKKYGTTPLKLTKNRIGRDIDQKA